MARKIFPVAILYFTIFWLTACATAKTTGVAAGEVSSPATNFSARSTIQASTQTFDGHITIDDNERTIYVQPGDRFLLDLGPDAGSGWAIRADDENLIQRADNAEVVPNTQGWFEAVQTGKTDLNARSHALCIHHEGCPEVFLFFTLHVVIQPSAIQ